MEWVYLGMDNELKQLIDGDISASISKMRCVKHDLPVMVTFVKRQLTFKTDGCEELEQRIQEEIDRIKAKYEEDQH